MLVVAGELTLTGECVAEPGVSPAPLADHLAGQAHPQPVLSPPATGGAAGAPGRPGAPAQPPGHRSLDTGVTLSEGTYKVATSEYHYAIVGSKQI